MYNIFVWSSDYENFTGEGLLARCFVENYFKSSESFRIRSNNSEYLFNKNKYFLLKKNIYINNFASKYLYPYYGILLIWYFHFKGKKTCYVNYLPLWNFLIFILLPRNTIIGPVTGSLYNDSVYNFNTFIRKIIFPFFYVVSLKIIFFKFKYIIFSTDNFKKIIPENKKKYCLFNFCLLFYKKRKQKKKNIDFLFYFRKHPQKSNLFLNYIIKKLTSLNFKIIVVGDKYILPKVTNYKNIHRYKLLNLLDRTHYSIMSADNFYSLFFLDCLSCNVFIFFNKKFRTDNYLPINSRFKILDYNKFSSSFDKIVKELPVKKRKRNKDSIHNQFIIRQKEISNFIDNIR
jgi:hypothetical protein